MFPVLIDHIARPLHVPVMTSAHAKGSCTAPIRQSCVV